MSVPPSMEFSGRFFLWLFLSIITLSACSTKPISGVAESEEPLRRFVADHRPPILLRVWGRTPTIDRMVTAGDPSSEASQAFGDIAEVGTIGGIWGLLLFSVPGAVGYLGTYYDVEKATAAMKECIAQLDEDEQDILELVRTVFQNESTSLFIERELQSSFNRNGLQQPTTLVSVADVFVTDEDMRRTEFVEAQRHTPSPTLLVGDVFQKLEWGLCMPERSCGFRLSIKLDLNGVEITPTAWRPLVTKRAIHASRVMEPKEFQKVSATPELLRAWVSESVSELTERIAKLYSPE